VSPDSTLRLAPDSTVRVAAQIQAEARPASGAPVKIDVVQFSTVSYAKGDVTSGWEFTHADKQTPAKQWCQYREPQPDGTLHLVTIAKDGHRVGLPTPSPFPSVDLQGAFANCVWWSASGTPAAAKAPAKPGNQAAPPPSHVISARAK
jgi:hypothetical protein